MNETIAIIGGTGNMGGAIANGLETHGLNKEQLILTNSVTNNNKEATSLSDVIILAVKPQKIGKVLREIKDSAKGKLIVSLAAGVTMESIAEALGDTEQKVVRVMPNLAARVDKSMSAWVANEYVTDEDKMTVRNILKPIGKEVEIEDEDLMDIITILSGSGPGALSFYLEATISAGKKLGLSEELALMLVKQMLEGTAELLNRVYENPASLRQAVTSKGGTTETVIDTMKTNMVDLSIEKSIFDGCRRARELRLS